MEATVWAHTVEGLFKNALGGRVSPALKAELKSLGLDLDQKPRDVRQAEWVPMLAAVVRHVYPSATTDDGYFQLGRALLNGYGETVIGKALFATFRLLGPERLVNRSVALLQNGNNYVKGKVTRVAPKHFELWVNECNGNPHYVRGIIVAGLTTAGAAQLTCELTSFDGHQATYIARWT